MLNKKLINLSALILTLLILPVGGVMAQGISHAAAPGNIWKMYLFLVPALLLFLYLSQRPQAKRAKEQRLMISNLQAGDELVTIGGIAGIVERLDGDYIVLRTSSSGTMRLQKKAVASIFPKGSIQFTD